MRKSSFDEILNSGKVALRDCDVSGLNAIKNLYGDKVTSVFLTAPKEEIRKRFISRNEPIESMEARLKDYDNYIKNSKYFDHVIENIEIDKTIEKILEILEDENKK